MEWGELLKRADVVIGLIITVLGGGWALIQWFKNRSNESRKSIEAVVKKASQDERSRLGQVEREVERIDGSLVRLDARVTNGFRDIDDRFHGIERRLDLVAKTEDVNALKVSNARTDSRMETLMKNDNELKEMIHRQGEAFSQLAATVVEKVTR